MKNYEQMAADVLHRAEVYTARKKRNRRIAATAVAFGCLSVLIAVNIVMIVTNTMGSPALEYPSIQMDNHTPQASRPTEGTKPQGQSPITVPGEDTFGDHGIVLLAARTMTALGTPLEDNLELPLNYSLRVRDFRGLTGEERLRAELEERALYEAKMNEGLGGASMKLGNCTNRENYMISFIRTGCFRLLWIKDHTSVERISIKSTTNYGKIDVSLSNNTFPKGHEVTLLPEDIPEWDWEHGLRINWKYSNAVLKALDENPSTPLSEFSDLLIFAVEFSDGSVKECKVELLIQDDGEVMARLLSTPTVA